MGNYDYDVIVLGCGPAGQKAAIKSAKIGRSVAMVDIREVVGGQCLHVGTIPSKTFRAAIIYLSGYYERKIYGPEYRVKELITVDDLLVRCNAIIAREIQIIHEQLTRNGVEVITGRGHFTDPHTICVVGQSGERCLSGANIVVCTGSTSDIVTELPFDNERVINTDDILKLKFIPRRLMVIGAGVIGLEYASMFSLLETEVTVVSRYPSLMPWVDRELMSALEAHMLRHGVEFELEERVQQIDKLADGVRVTLTSGKQVEVDMVMYAAPRKGNTAELNLEAAGIEVDERSCIPVKGNYRSAVEHILAAGDVIGWPSLASTAIDQGRKAANTLLGVPDVPYDPLFPYGIYTFPDISMIGDSEEGLRKKDQPYEVGIGHYRDTSRGQIIGDDDGLMKLLFDPDTRKLLGVHIIGYEATELIHIGQAVMIADGKIDYFIDTVFNFPTLAEVYKIAALNGFNKTQAALPTERL